MFPWYLIVLAVSIGLPISIRFVVQWLIVPMRIRKRQWMPIEPGFMPAAPEHFTPDVRESLHVLLAEFAALGFKEPAGVFVAIPGQGLRSLQTVLVDRGTGDVGIISHVRSEGTRATAFAVLSEFQDGRSVLTQAYRGIGNLPTDPEMDALNFSWVRDARTLCEIHRRRLQRLGKSLALRAEPPTGHEVEYARRRWHRETARHVEAGYKVADTVTNIYQFTRKGAFLSVWKLQQPIKGLRMLLRDIRAHRVWRELGMDTWTPPPPVVTVPFASPASGIAAVESGPSPLRYESGLADGQVAYDVAGDAVTVRMGRPTVARYLLSRWPTLLSIGIWSSLLSFNFYLYWRVQQMQIRAGRATGPTWIGLPTIVMAAFLLNDVVRLLMAVLNVRGTVLITANRHGLTFRNVPAFDHSGFIPRDDLASLVVLVQKPTFRKPIYSLHANLDSGRRQLLLTGPDHATIEDARSRIAAALGLETPGVMRIDS